MLVIVVILAIVGLVLLARAWPRSDLSDQEQREIADAPMPALMKRAWLGLIIALTTAATITTLVAVEGAMTYWEDDAFRLNVMLIFIGGLVIHSVLMGLLASKDEQSGGMDERDRAILARAPTVQSTAVLLALAGDAGAAFS
jgi:hypothetical protein